MYFVERISKICYINAMRIISGRNRGKKLLLPNFEGTRPTADLVKTSMFGLINDYIEDSIVLDLFGGSGALGLECLSRYAKEVIFVDNNPKSCELIKKNALSMNYKPEIIKLDYLQALNLLKRKNKIFDIILLDPPYHKEMETKALQQINKLGLLSEKGICVVEMAKSDSLPPQIYELYEELKNRTFGIKRILVLKPKQVTEEENE